MKIKMTNNTKIILKSLSITSLVSLLFAAAIMLVTQNWYGFIAGLIFGFVIQLVGFYFWNTHLINKKQIAELQYSVNAESIASTQRIILNCAYCRSENVVDILLDRGNEFICKTCGGKNVVMIEFSTAQKTEPLDLQPSELFAPIVKDISEPIEFKP